MFSYTSVHECRLSCGLNSVGSNSNACKTYVFSYTSVHECRLSCGLSFFGSDSNTSQSILEVEYSPDWPVGGVFQLPNCLGL